MSSIPQFARALFVCLCASFAISAYAAELTVTNVVEIRNVNLTSEGSLDWIHFGLVDASSVNRKSGVPQRLTYAPVSAFPARFHHAPELRSSLSWTDGTPTTSTGGFSGGWFYSQLGAGYTITAPADTQTRTLTVHTGGWNSSGVLVLSLSDNSAAPVNVNLSGSAVYHHTITVVYSANSPGQTLMARHTLGSTGGNIAIQGATLAGPAPNNPPILTNPGNKSVTEGNPLTFSVNATDSDGPAPLALSVSSSTPALPPGVFTDNGDGTGVFNWTPASQHVGTWNVTFRAADDGGSGQQDTESITITVNPASSGLLQVNAPVTAPSNNSLTSEGTLDWMHFGLTTAASVNRKSGVPVRLSYNKLTVDPGRFGNGPEFRHTHTWTDGTPTAANAGFSGGVFFPGVNSGYTLTAPADTQIRTAKVYLGGWNSSSQLSVTLSDGSASPVTLNMSGTGVYHHVATIVYSAGSAGQTVTITHRMTGGTGNIALQAASLNGSAVNNPPVLTNPGNRTVAALNPISFNVTATDPDGPAPLVLDISGSSPALPANASFIDNGGGTGSFNWTPSSLQTGTWNVTFRARENNGSGQSDLETISITVNPNAAPVLAAIGNKSVNVGNTLSFPVSATDPDGPAPMILDISASSPSLPPSASLTDNGNGTGVFNWSPTAAHVGAWSVTFRVRDDNGSGQSDSETINIQVTAASAGQLSVTVPTPIPYTNSLTSEGSLDWMHFGLTGSTSINRKAGVASQLTYTRLAGTASQFGNGPAFRPTHTWSDGTPTVSSNGFSGGLFFPGAGASYRITAPADTSERTLKVHLGGWNSSATLNVALSDNSATAFSTTLSGVSVYHREAIIVYKAASAGQTVQLTLTATSGAGNIVLQSATLAGPALPLLPFSDDFGDGNANGWTTVNESVNLGNWTVVSGELRQTNMVEDASARIGTYQLGSYLYLNAGMALTDYRFGVAASHIPQNGVLAEDVGVMFRYQNPNNYYRLSLNSRHGYTRLEKRVAGTFTTLAVNARGYRPAVTQNIVVETRGSNLFVWINGDPVFAIADSSIASGTVALYAKHQSRFDNVTITVPGSDPSIVLGTPTAFSTRDSGSIVASALAANVPAGGNVRFLLNGGNAVVDSTAPYGATWSSIAPGNHAITAELRNASNVAVASDTNTVVGVTGDEVVAIGDSITNGIGDFYAADNISQLERFIGVQGPQASLIDSLDATRGFTPTIVYNEGMGGDEAFDAAFSRIDSIKERYPGMDRVLIGLGTNDVFSPVPSGFDCPVSSCPDSFKAYMQVLIDKIRFTDFPTNSVPSNVDVHVAMTPPVWLGSDPWNSSANVLIREYNRVIAEQLVGASTGPDLYGYFMPSAAAGTHRPWLFSDSLHPNGLGYEIIAVLWHNALEPASPLPLPFTPAALATSVAAHAIQVDLMESGDQFRLGSTHTLTSIPAALAQGRWIKTANLATNNSSNFLSFSVDRPVTVYIAYDGGSSARPNWMSGWSATGQEVTTTDPLGASMLLYSRTFTANSAVVLGGNGAAGAVGADSNYIAIIVEN